MEALFAMLLEFFGELLLQVIVELLAEFGFHIIREPFRKQPSAWLAALGYALFGAVAGGISLLVAPTLFISAHGARVANVVLTPLIAGATMAVVGKWRRGQEEVPEAWLARFIYGYIFALAMALIRFSFGQ
jgi:hypothetical protein